MRLCRIHSVRPVLVSVVLLAASGASGQTWDLAADWSDTQNPNGPWSYNDASGQPIPVSHPDYDPSTGALFGSPQPAWAAAVFPLNNHVPVWLKRVSDFAGVDLPIGRVGMHGSEGDDPPAWIGVSWTSPVNEAVDLSGVVWYAHTGLTRRATWRLRVNDTVLTTGSVAWNDGSSSTNPTSLADGDGGPLALDSIGVDPGDVIALEFISTTTIACFVGLDLTITVDPCLADMNDDDLLDLSDVTAFVAAFVAGAPAADLAEPFGLFDLADVLGFVGEFLAGCP